MRYLDGGGLTASGRARREQVRLRAAALFEHDMAPVQVAKALRVSTKSAYQWRRRWQAGGTVALASTGPGGNPCRLSPAQQSAHRAGERDEDAITAWRTEAWAKVRG